MSYLHDWPRGARDMKPHFTSMGGQQVVVVKYTRREDREEAKRLFSKAISGLPVKRKSGWDVDYGSCSSHLRNYCFYCGRPGIFVAELRNEIRKELQP